MLTLWDASQKSITDDRENRRSAWRDSGVIPLTPFAEARLPEHFHNLSEQNRDFRAGVLCIRKARRARAGSWVGSRRRCRPRGVDPLMLGNMAIQRMDHVSVVVDDLEAAMAFFVELGMELEGEARVEGRWVDRVAGLDDVRVDIAMMRTPDGHGRLELTKFHTPRAVSAEPENAPANTLGIRSIMFAVEDIEEVLARLHTHGAELVGELAQYEDSYRLCYVRGPEGIIVALAEQLS
jgi:catechol 2,3-dioxygenase-like lactoylglutathione lyase family enzyme